MNDTLISLYDELLSSLHGKNSLAKSMTVFNAIKGKNEVPELMVVGRATNGWGNYYNLNYDHNEQLEKVRNNMVYADLLNTINSWRSKTGSGNYEINKSQFWRVTKRIAKSIVKLETEEVLNSVCYTNLYKVSPDGYNPSQSLMRCTIESNIRILQYEINFYKPKRVLFLTGNTWAKPFICKIATEKYESPSPDIFFLGRYQNIDLVVTHHPQGKGETNIVEAIRQAWNLTPGNVK
jgi:hypothetical protein